MSAGTRIARALRARNNTCHSVTAACCILLAQLHSQDCRQRALPKRALTSVAHFCIGTYSPCSPCRRRLGRLGRLGRPRGARTDNIANANASQAQAQAGDFEEAGWQGRLMDCAVPRLISCKVVPCCCKCPCARAVVKSSDGHVLRASDQSLFRNLPRLETEFGMLRGPMALTRHHTARCSDTSLARAHSYAWKGAS